MRFLFLLLATLLMIAGTWLAGWMAVPAVAAVYALVRRDRRTPGDAGVAALLAWLALLLRDAKAPAFASLLHQLGQIFPVPGIVVAALSLLLAVILAASAARLVIGIVGVRGER